VTHTLWSGQSACVVQCTLHVPPGYIVAVKQLDPPAQLWLDVHGPPTTLPSRPTPVDPQPLENTSTSAAARASFTNTSRIP
jgi:hypothetical protein